MEGVSKLSARFEMMGQAENSPTERVNPPPRPSSPASYRPSSPVAKQSNLPRRPPPPTPLEKAQGRRLSGSPMSYGEEREAGQSEQSDAKRPLHPLEKSKSKSVSDIKSILVGTKDSAAENGAANQGKSDEVDGPAAVKKEGKKGKKSKDDSDVSRKKSKEDADVGKKKSKEDSDVVKKKSKEDSDVGKKKSKEDVDVGKRKSKEDSDLKSGMLKLSSWLNFKGKSSEAKNSPKSSPLFGRARNISTPTAEQQQSPPSSSPQPQSPDLSARNDSPDGATKKEPLRKSESSSPDFAGGGKESPKAAKRTNRSLRSTRSASAAMGNAEPLKEEKEEEIVKMEEKVEAKSPSASPQLLEEVKEEKRGLSVEELAKHAHDTLLKGAGLQ